MNKLLLSISCSILILSCVGNSPSVLETPLETFPIEPPLETYAVPPIIRKQDDNFLVTSTFVFNSISLKEYNDKIREWRKKNKVD